MVMKLQVIDAGFHYESNGSRGFADVNFSVKNGDVMSILGPNGCGKTTLLKCLDNLIKLHEGSITINDQDISKLSDVEIAKSIGYVPKMHQPLFLFLS